MLDPARPKPELRALTAMRGVAALVVVLQHFLATAQLKADRPVPSIVAHGYMAVDFFFVLSGFIMSYTYLAGFETLGLRAYGPFLWKRVARIFPLGIFVTLLILLLAAAVAPFGLAWLFTSSKDAGQVALRLVVNVLHIQGFLPDENLNDPSWSVSVELGAYLLFPLLIVLMYRAPPVVTALCVALGVAVLMRISSLSPGWATLVYRSPVYDLGRCVAEFCFGMLVFRAYRAPTVLHRLGDDRWTIVVALAAVASMLLRNDLLAAASFPFLVLAFALNRGRAGRALGTPVLHWLGVISFSIYLIHNLFRTPVFWVLKLVHPDPLTPSLAVAVALAGSALTLPFAVLAYHFVEKPGRDALNRLVRRLPFRRGAGRTLSSAG